MLDHVGRTDLARCLRGAINAALNEDKSFHSSNSAGLAEMPGLMMEW